MNISFEFARIRNSFVKVKEDMNLISQKIHENYDKFLHEHNILVKEVKELSKIISNHKNNFKKEYFDKNEIEKIKEDIKKIKKTISETIEYHDELKETLKKIRNNSSQMKELKEKLHMNELEVYLMKERLIEKDFEIKQMKEINSHMLKALDELANIETKILKNK